MERLLQWSLRNSNGKYNPDDPIDPNAFAELLGKPNETTLMKAAHQILINNEVRKDDKLDALESLESLTENPDNANALEGMKLWDPIVKLINSRDNELANASCGVVSAAAQNNIQCQTYLCKNFNIISYLLEDISRKNVRQKALLALSSIIINCKLGYDNFKKDNGWLQLFNTYKSEIYSAQPDKKVLRRSLRLINGILASEDPKIIYKTLSELNFIQELIKLLTNSTGDVLNEAVNIFIGFSVPIVCLSQNEQKEVKNIIRNLITNNKINQAEFDEQDWNNFKRFIQS